MRRSKSSASLCWILLQMGFTEGSSHPSPGGLLPHHFTLTETLRLWRYLSVALSLALRPVDVIDHLARWSPDFPPLGDHFARKRTEERLPSLPTLGLYHRATSAQKSFVGTGSGSEGCVERFEGEGC